VVSKKLLSPVFKSDFGYLRFIYRNRVGVIRKPIVACQFATALLIYAGLGIISIIDDSTSA